MIEEISGGLRNALERGASLEEAVQSFIKAGYNPIEVRQAAQSLSYLPQTMRPVAEQVQEGYKMSALPSLPNQQPQKTNYSLTSSRSKPRAKKNILVIILILLLLILVGGLVYFIFFGKELLDSFLG